MPSNVQRNHVDSTVTAQKREPTQNTTPHKKRDDECPFQIAITPITMNKSVVCNLNPPKPNQTQVYPQYQKHGRKQFLTLPKSISKPSKVPRPLSVYRSTNSGLMFTRPFQPKAMQGEVLSPIWLLVALCEFTCLMLFTHTCMCKEHKTCKFTKRN